MTQGRYGVLIRVLEPRARFETAGEPRALAAALREVGLQLPSNPNTSACSAAGLQVYWLGPRRYVITASMPDEERVQRQLIDAFDRFPAADVFCTTDMVVRFELDGPGAASILAQGTALDVSDAGFAVGVAAVTDLWGVAAVVERSAESPLSRIVTVDRSLAGFIEGWLHTANGQPSARMPGVMRTAAGA
jgi:heterotetrameric sarcosine oxidase gamma subunit